LGIVASEYDIGFAGSQGDLISEVEWEHYRLQFVIAIRSLANDAQVQVDFCWRKEAQRGRASPLLRLCRHEVFPTMRLG
jgi:hypothetical protein